jgi:hypothetical protein
VRKCSQVSITMELTFTPDEFVVLEDIEFDETVQRAEAVRFYTLDEQQVDAYEKMIPKGRVTQFARDEVRKQVERLRALYDQFVVPTAEEYKLREPEFARKFSWLYPVYATKDRNAYDFGAQWLPLFDDMRQPNFYNRMIAALPRPYASISEGRTYSVDVPTEFLNSDGRNPSRVLPMYVSTRAQIHEDKTVTIIQTKMSGSEDVVPFVGYYAAKRPVPIPNPLQDHQLLKSNESTFIDTTAELKEIAPSLDAILTHGVPVTSDPYGVAAPYLKVYDVKLTDIPWSAWKSKFPQADRMESLPETIQLTFPKPSQNAPGEKIRGVYGAQYSEGISCRHWLSLRPDGGEFVIKALMSKTIDNGSVEAIPGVNLPALAYPATTPEECTLMGIPFDEFNLKGILRRSWIIEHRKTGDVDVISFACVPLEFIKQERARVGYLNRLPWTDSTATDILEKHQRVLHANRLLGDVVEKVVPQSKTPARSESIKRKEVLAIFNDRRRFASDKFRDITELLRDTTLTNNLYSDTDGEFVACDHMLAILSGDLANDRFAFYDTWTAREDGFRVCKFCGEQVNSDVTMDQEEFDEDGFVIRHTSAETGPEFKPAGIADFVTGLTALKGLFDLTNPMDSTCYMLLSLLHVLPTAETMDPLLKITREVVATLGSKDSEKMRSVKGCFGIAAAIVLLQTHNPILLPRRSFGTKALKLNGYPRDQDQPDRFSIVDSMIKVIKKTFEELPAGPRGPPQDTIKAILNTPTTAKNDIFTALEALVERPEIAPKLKEAKVYHAGIVKVEEPDALIPVVLPPETMNVIKSYVECPSARPILGGPNPPKTQQPTFPLYDGIHAAKGAKFLQPVASTRQGLQDVPKAAIQKRVAMEKNAKSKIPVTDEYRTNLILASRLNDMLRKPNLTSSVNPNQKAAELRDIGRGFVYEALSQIPAVDRTKDIALYTLTSKYKEEKAAVNKLRATERLKFVEEMSKRSDAEREIIGDLLKKGLAPYIITIRDRALFARQAENLQRQVGDYVAETGVGMPHDLGDQGEGGTTAGNYGDYLAIPNNDGRDYNQPTILGNP